ncbi:DUF559 domain-containing protein [uncultured Brevundimonas sp.]|uniref:endonuclease domain-containing protein n=1 Tax=uncultured Brevundimonas sp. TaxID=213418 RepID=UPI0030EB1587
MQPEQTIRRARRLRKTTTHAETYLWTLLRDRQLDGLRFRRQVPIGDYVIDFACLSARLIVEADGGVHVLRTFDDGKRDAWLRSQNFTVVRFRNAQIMDRPHEVIAAIRAAATPPSERLRRPPSPEMGEGIATPCPSPPCGGRWLAARDGWGPAGCSQNRRSGAPPSAQGADPRQDTPADPNARHEKIADIPAGATPPSERLHRPPSPEMGEGVRGA